MQAIAQRQSQFGLENHGISNIGVVHWNLSTPKLYEEAIRRRGGEPCTSRTSCRAHRTSHGALAKRSIHCGEPPSADKVWWGKVNRPISQENYEGLRRRLLAYLQGRDLFVEDCFVGADQRYRMPIRVITEPPGMALFSHNMFIQASADDLADMVPDFTVIHAPGFHAIPEIDGTRKRGIHRPQFRCEDSHYWRHRVRR